MLLNGFKKSIEDDPRWNSSGSERLAEYREFESVFCPLMSSEYDVLTPIKVFDEPIQHCRVNTVTNLHRMQHAHTRGRALKFSHHRTESILLTNDDNIRANDIHCSRRHDLRNPRRNITREEILQCRIGSVTCGHRIVEKQNCICKSLSLLAQL